MNKSVNANECAAAQLREPINGCGVNCGCPYWAAKVQGKAPELLESVRELNACLVLCLTGGEVSANRAGKAIEMAATLIEDIEK